MIVGVVPELVVMRTDELGQDRFGRIDALAEAAFERPFAQIWASIGPGVHVIAEIEGDAVGHAMVVERELRIAERPLRCGYVENVATAPRLHGQGIGSIVMRRIASIIADDFEIGSLATGSNHFYERLGWETWRGPCFVRRDGELLRTADHDGDVMVLRTATTPAYTGHEPISVAWRPGEPW